MLVLVNIFKNSRKVQQIQINSLSFNDIGNKQYKRSGGRSLVDKQSLHNSSRVFLD